MPFLYRLSSTNTLSIKQLHQALQQVVIKHQSLRTSLVFNEEMNVLLQRIIDHSDNNNKLFEFIESTFETDEQLNNIMYDEKTNPRIFDLTQGHVFRCHLVYYKEISSNDLLTDKDALSFNFHHALFDFASIDLFLRDLDEAYSTGQLTTDEETLLRYVDCEYLHISNHTFSLFVFRCYYRTTNADECCQNILA